MLGAGVLIAFCGADFAFLAVSAALVARAGLAGAAARFGFAEDFAETSAIAGLAASSDF